MFPAKQTGTKRNQRQKGAVIVEFTLSFLLFIILSIGLFEMAAAMWVWTTLSHAARQGARFAMVHGNNNPVTDSTIEQLVKDHAIGLLPNDITVTVTWEDATDKDPGDFVAVGAMYPFGFVTGSAFLSNGSIQLGSTSRMTIAY
jgi:Flp pilus assembly protein TadG